MGRLECGKPAEWRTPDTAIPHRARDQYAALFEPAPQTSLDLPFELIGIGEHLKSAGVVTVAALGPPLPDNLQDPVLLHILLRALGAIENRFGFAKQIKRRRAIVSAAQLKRGFVFVDRPALETFCAAGSFAFPERRIELQADASPKDANN